MPRCVIERTLQGAGRTAAEELQRIVRVTGAGGFAILAWLVAAPAALATPGGGHSAATITALFADSCRDFGAHSSKDISYVDFHYVDGRAVKDESIHSHDYATDGGAGDEIELAIVKSGTTTQQFDCAPSNGAPTARLDIKTPEQCHEFFSGGLECEQSLPRTVWTSTSQIPDTGGDESGAFHWGCGFYSDFSLCSWTMSFRGSGSSDPDSDIATWSLDFGDGTSVNGSGSTPPTEVTHEYSLQPSGVICGAAAPYYSDACVITLTVTDSAGQSDSEVMLMLFLNEEPG